MVIRAQIARQHPWVILNLLKAFGRANDIAERERVEHAQYHLDAGLLPFEAAQSLRAIADRQAVEIIAASRRDSEILRGEGEAERSLIFANAYSQDREFFEFYRSMQSYRTALGATGTTMVLSPDSEFFRYFGGGQPEGTTQQLPATPSPTAVAPAVAPEAETPVGSDAAVTSEGSGEAAPATAGQ